MLKQELINLVRCAQNEPDFNKRAELWRQIREAGVPPDATMSSGPVIGILDARTTCHCRSGKPYIKCCLSKEETRRIVR
jgi:hypothetical protein